jgi:hypothetical protein
MEDVQRPWTWKDDRTVTLVLDEGPKDFTLGPVNPQRLERFRQDLSMAINVTQTLLKARKAFEGGTAEYTNAVRRLKKLNVEYGKALDEQLAIAQGVGAFFIPGGIEKQFGSLVDVITEFSAETILHARKPVTAAPPPAGSPPAPPPARELAEDPPSGDPPADESDPEGAGAGAGVGAGVADGEAVPKKTAE